MKLTFLGTGAADWDINAFAPGVEFRRFSSALVNDDLLIDPGPHIFHFAQYNGTPEMFRNVRNIIVTHTHSDHFCIDTVEKLCVGTDVTLWGDPACLRKLLKHSGPEKTGKMHIKEFGSPSGDPYSIGGYEIWPLRSNHETEDLEEITRLYLIGQTPEHAGGGENSKNGESGNNSESSNSGENGETRKNGEALLLYYGCDSSWIPTASWNVIKNKPVNAMVLELTCGTAAPNDWRIFEHNTLEMLELMLKTFRKYNYFAPDVRYYVSHMARTLHAGHSELKKELEPLGVTPAYDGLTVTI